MNELRTKIDRRYKYIIEKENAKLFWAFQINKVRNGLVGVSGG